MPEVCDHPRHVGNDSNCLLSLQQRSHSVADCSVEFILEPLQEVTIFPIHGGEGGEWNTSFNTTFGYFEYTVMACGHTTAPAVSKSLINEFLNLFSLFILKLLSDFLQIFERP